MTQIRTEWWRRATSALEAGRFNVELRQLHGVANLSEYSGNPEEARITAKYSYDMNRLFETALQIFTAASLEVATGKSIMDKDIREALRNIGRLLYFLYRGEGNHFKSEDLLMDAAIAFELAGNMANSATALMLRDQRSGEPKASESPNLDLVLYLLLSRRINELNQIIVKWRQSMPKDNNEIQNSCLITIEALRDFIIGGNPQAFQKALESANLFANWTLNYGITHEWYQARSLQLIMQRLQHTSTWLQLREHLQGLPVIWKAYIRGLALGSSDFMASRILNIRVRGKSVIDLWPSQIEALSQGLLLDDNRDWVVRMPTSAGKTRIAEFGILKALSENPQAICIYVVPYIALSNEIRNSLRGSLGSVGVRVADLFQGEYELTDIDNQLLQINNVVICTPEKLDLMLRRSSDFLTRVGLFVFDEGHMIDQTSRGVRYEFLINRLIKYRQRKQYQYHLMMMSAVIPNANELAIWVTGSENGLLQTDWKPTEVRFGVFHWMGEAGTISYPKEQRKGERYFVYRVIERKKRRTRYYPENKSQICAELACALVKAGPVVVFCASKPNVRGVTNALFSALDRGNSVLPMGKGDTHAERLNIALQVCEDYLGPQHDLYRALKQGFAYHTGDVPQAVRAQIEKLYNEGTIQVMVCTNTLAQGVNLPIKSLIAHSLNRAGPGTRISSRDFMNMAGRAARALRQLEGQVIFVHDDSRRNFLSSERLVQDQDTPEGWVISSIMLLYSQLAQERGELISDERSRRIFDALVKSRRLEDPDQMAEGMAALDGQLLGMLVEEDLEASSVDAKQIFSRSLFDIQSTGYQIDSTPLYLDLTNRMVSIAEQLHDSDTRRRFFRTGLSSTSCSSIREDTNEILLALRNAPSTLEHARETIQTLFKAAIKAEETKPRTKSLQIEDLFTPFWSWLGGTPVGDIHKQVDVTPEILSMTIEDLFVRKVPWGVNSLLLLLEEEIEQECNVLPGYIKYLSALSRYGVPSPVPAIIRAIGVSSRTYAIRLGAAYPFDQEKPAILEVAEWLSELRLEDLVTIIGNEDGAKRVFSELQEAQLGNPGVGKFQENGWNDVEVRGLRFYVNRKRIQSLKTGTVVTLRREPENRYDTNAIQVLIPSADQMIGYIDRDYARIIAPAMDSGIPFSSTVSKLVPPTKHFPSGRLFLNILEEA
jgi:helicase